MTANGSSRQTGFYTAQFLQKLRASKQLETECDGLTWFRFRYVWDW